MFVYNAICVMSDQLTSKAGTITSGEDRFMEWKTKDGDYENTQYAQFDTFFEGMFQKKRLLDIIKNFICFSNEGINSFKILAGYHQYFAVRKAIESTKHATVTDGKGGVFWHTQGSGKSLSMVFYAHLLQQALDSPTIVVITDRNDLDDQLYGQFAKCKDFLRQEPMHAESRENLKNLLDGRKANGIIFTTMQKFEESHEPLSERHNIVVMADEAHRGQYGLTETVDAKTGKVKIGTARIIRNTLPNATYIGFTGTPISSKDRSTREVFGDYIDIYDMTQAVEDGATRPVYYESRVIKLNLDEATLKMIDAEYDIMAENADNEVIEKSKRELGQMEAVLGNDNTINSLVCDILDHYENNRENLLTGKAMIVAYSRPIAMKIYKRILELRPAWTEKVAVVMTSGNNDPEEWREIIGNKHHKNELAKKFKDNNSPLKIAIVVDMWLTGFDVPSLATMYVYKPMSGHNLMQAIARVNRVFRDKEGGLVVDYVGIATALKQAMNDYTSRDKKNYGDTDVAKVAYPKFLEKLSVCRDKFHGYDYSKFQNGTDLERAKTISGAVNFIMGREKVDEKDSFVKEALKGLLQTTSDGSTKLMDFLDEQRMCRLYEKFILEYYRKEHPEIRASASQIPWDTDDDYREMLPVMQSDIMLKSVDKTLVIDAKYYAHTTQSQYNTNTLHSGNLYQIFTYVKNLDTSNSGNVAGMLLYAKTDEIVLPNNDYKMGGNQISVKTLDLDCEFAEIKRQLDDIVQGYFGCS